MTSRFLRRLVVSELVQSRGGADEFARSCSSDHEEEHEDGDMCEKRQQEASSCRLLLPRQSKLPLCIVRLTVFRARACKVRARSKRGRERERGHPWDGLRSGCRVHRWPDASRTQRCSLVYAELAEVEQSSIPMSWLGNSTLDSPAETGPVILLCIGCTGFTGRGRSLDPFYLPTYGRPGALLIQKKGIGQERIEEEERVVCSITESRTPGTEEANV